MTEEDNQKRNLVFSAFMELRRGLDQLGVRNPVRVVVEGFDDYIAIVHAAGASIMFPCAMIAGTEIVMKFRDDFLPAFPIIRHRYIIIDPVTCPEGHRVGEFVEYIEWPKIGAPD